MSTNATVISLFLIVVCCQATRCCNAATTDGASVVPLIDLKPWFNSVGKDEVAEKVAEACRNVGFFMIQNHGLDLDVMEEAWEASRSFFDLPTKEKLQHKTTNEAEYPYGYEQSEQLAKGKSLDDEQNGDTGTSLDGEVDLKETFAIGPNKLESGMPMRRWVNTPLVPTFRPALEEYYAKMEDLANALLQIFALALKLPVDYFENKMDHHMSALRLVHYYPLSNPRGEDHLVRAGAHTDYGALTILNAQSSGLQVLLRRDNETKWYSVPVTPGALIINLGDLMQRWTNDKWVSTLHRVVMPSTDAMERRYSIAFFVNVNGDTIIETLDSCQDDGQESSYPPITARDHLMAKHLASMDEAPHDEL